ncbi:hypothetical protein FZC76_04225 [Sutcliffiella horikoshii]|uniref:Aerobactin siderophore biosynthesis IucA/IucC-like C-terminal domain-containing protein n=1 Tax=Sutcliffiella horikoshii TaxID=79883 RepID=A0A5D4T4P5_9BACI|nr:hypothetical protein [Sutcliffiella horikoshii]TYS69452.1 hypothetical protein FZC76_04225 [Sutcliffiella horikoshii]
MIKKLFLIISLKRYGVLITSKPKEKGHFSIQELINNPNKLHEILVCHQKEGMNNPNLTIIGTMFGKRYSVLAMSVIDTMILSGKLFDASPENIYLKITESGAFYFYIHPKNIFPLQSLTLDEKQQLIQNFNNNHLKTLFKEVAKISNSKEQHLLSLVSHNLHQRSLFLQRRFPKKKGNIEQILNLFIKDNNSEQNNPLNFTFNKIENAEGSVQYIRKYCCLEYLQHNRNLDKCCSTCPHLYK